MLKAFADFSKHIDGLACRVAVPSIIVIATIVATKGSRHRLQAWVGVFTYQPPNEGMLVLLSRALIASEGLKMRCRCSV